MKMGGQTTAPAAVLQGGDGPSTHRLIGQFGPTVGHDFLKKRKMVCFCRVSNSGWCSPYHSQYTDWDHVLSSIYNFR